MAGPNFTLVGQQSYAIGSGASFQAISPAVSGRRSVITVKANDRDVILLYANVYAGAPGTYVLGQPIEMGLRNLSNAIFPAAIAANSAEVSGLNFVPGFSNPSASGFGQLVVTYQSFVGDRGNTNVGAFLGNGSALVLSALASRDVLMPWASSGRLRVPAGCELFFSCNTVDTVLQLDCFGCEIFDSKPANAAA